MHWRSSVAEECPAKVAQLYSACLSKQPERCLKAANLERVILGTLNGGATTSTVPGVDTGSNSTLGQQKFWPSLLAGYKRHRSYTRGAVPGCCASYHSCTKVLLLHGQDLLDIMSISDCLGKGNIQTLPSLRSCTSPTGSGWSQLACLRQDIEQTAISSATALHCCCGVTKAL